MQKQKIVCVHLLNDFSGSPLVLSRVVEGFIKEGHQVDLYTNANSNGFLNNIDNCNYNYFNYSWSKFKLFTFVKLMWSQMLLFFKFLKYKNEDAIIYINTVLPFGAALAAKVNSNKVVYHIHETSITPNWWKAFLFGIANKTADKVIYVSNYLNNEEALAKPEKKVVYNALSEEFVKTAMDNYSEEKQVPFTILMLCSLKKYKGVDVFYKAAKFRPGYQFNLVLNASKEEINKYFKGQTIPQNLTLFDRQSDVHPFYNKTDIVVNLSIPGEWNETFGMTALEAMQYGKPVIVPPVGGIAEIVDERIQGLKIDSSDISAVLSGLDLLAEDKRLYKQMSANASIKAKQFQVEVMQTNIIDFVKNKTSETQLEINPSLEIAK